ncbi:MAG TPA: hypothetical protein VD902_01015 [Symbiobacteriaceae bacterium]|nr:hypothetical protein [Symbiobacteriaceae bacterium]
MKAQAVKVPAQLLLDHRLEESARLLWMLMQFGTRPALAPHTVRKGLAQLEGAGWLPASRAPLKAYALVPGDLLRDDKLGTQAKLWYGILQLTPSEVTYPALSRLGGVSPTTAKQAVKTLRANGWLDLTQQNKHSPIHFTLHNPMAKRREAELARVKDRLVEQQFRGEALMREYLSLLVDCDEHDDNASPSYLVNPYAGEEMQFDRYYPPGVAFEFQGAQHFGPTDRYPDDAKARKQRARDYIKQGICADRKVQLVTVVAEDLSMERMQQKVTGLLPLRDLYGYDPHTRFLDRVSQGYRRKAR